jgi:hypothetical protein
VAAVKASTAQRQPKPAKPASAADRILRPTAKPDNFTVAEARRAVRKLFEERKRRQAAEGA